MNASRPQFPWRFVFLAYGITWFFWIPVVLAKLDYQTSPILLALMFLGASGPGIAGIALTYRELGKEGGRDFWHRVVDFRRISPRWVALILLLFPTLHLGSIAIHHWLGGNPPEFAFIKEAIAMPAGLLAITILYLLQATLEELGWRGYMLDRMQTMWKPGMASIVLGMVHALWHLPLFWIVGTNQNRYRSSIDFVLFVAFVLTGSVFSTWCYNDNHRSTLAVILLHTVANLSLDTFLLPGTGERIFKIVAALGAAVILIAWTRSCSGADRTRALNHRNANEFSEIERKSP